MIIFGGDSKRVKKISNGCLGDSCVFITSKPQQTLCGQYMVKIPGVSAGWFEEYFLQASWSPYTFVCASSDQSVHCLLVVMEKSGILAGMERVQGHTAS